MPSRHRSGLRPEIDERRRFGRLRQVTPLTAAVLTALYGAHALADSTVADSAVVDSTAANSAVANTTASNTTASNTDAANPATASSTAANSAARDQNAIQEVTVTATRRTANAQDLPISITAVSGAVLEQAGIQDLAQLAQSMAGVDYTDKGPFSGIAGANLIIRGLNSDATGWLAGEATPDVPAVATYVDDTPLFVNLRLEDLERVEILRGPQGTLYGSGSLGGTIRFVTNAPDPSGFDARFQLGVGDTDDAGAPNGEAHAMVNIPLADTLAIRASGSWTYDAGYINQPNLYVLNPSGEPVSAQPGNLFSPPVTYDESHANDYEYRTAHIAALWKPNESFHAQLSYYYQLGTAGGFPYIAQNSLAYTQPISPVTQYLGPPNLLQLYPATVPDGITRLSNADNGPSSTRDEVNVAALTLEYDLGFATFTSSSSWSHHVAGSVVDETAEYLNFGFYQSSYGQNPRTYVVGNERLDDKPWAQELRLASRSGGLFDWLAGLFYQHQNTYILEDDYTPGYLDFYNACEPLYGQGNDVTASQCGYGESLYAPGPTQYVDGLPIIKDQAYVSSFDTTFTDLAFYGELTAHLTSKWSVTGGTRVFRQTVDETQVNAVFYQGPEDVTDLTLGNSWRKALWKLNTAYQLDPKNLVYATWSQGFRRGLVNALPATESQFSPVYVTNPALRLVAPDTADNYEIGAKGTVANRFRYSMAIYDIQWHNIQEGVDLTPLVLPGGLNIGDGYSRGLESEFEAILTQHLSAYLDYTYDKTKFTSASTLFSLPNTSVAPAATGGPLPGTPLNSVAGGFAYGNVMWAGGEWRYAISAHYQSSVIPALSATVPTVPGYTMVDTQISYQRTHWLTTLYCTNLTNNLGITSYQDPGLFGNRAQAIISQPRTIGIRFAYSYE
jgi:iron complex outermembrane recepter protein